MLSCSTNTRDLVDRFSIYDFTCAVIWDNEIYLLDNDLMYVFHYTYLQASTVVCIYTSSIFKVEHIKISIDSTIYIHVYMYCIMFKLISFSKFSFPVLYKSLILNLCYYNALQDDSVTGVKYKGIKFGSLKSNRILFTGRAFTSVP